MQVERPFSLLEVIQTLEDSRTRFVLTGVFGLSRWVRKPRASQYIEVIVAPSRVSTAIERLKERCRTLDAVEVNGCIELGRRRTTIVPAIRIHASTRPCHEVVLSNVEPALWKGHPFRIPGLELAIAGTFASMMRRPWTDADKHQDAHDFLCMVNHNETIELDRLRDLGEAHAKGMGSKVVRKVKDVRAGKRFEM